MYVHEFEDGKIQFAVMDSLHEMFEKVLDPTGLNCRDRVNAEAAAKYFSMAPWWSSSSLPCGEIARRAVDAFLRPTHEANREVERAKTMMEKMLDDIGVERARPMRRIKRRLEAGDELDTQAYIARRADGWDEVRKERRMHKAIKLGVNVSMASAMVSAGLSVSRGAALAAMADILEDIGYSTEISLFDVTMNAGALCKTYVIETPAKSLSMPLDVDQIAFMGSNPDFIAQVVFPMQYRVLRGASNNWGQAGAVPRDIAKTYDFMMDRVFTLETAVQRIKMFALAMKTK